MRKLFLFIIPLLLCSCGGNPSSSSEASSESIISSSSESSSSIEPRPGYINLYAINDYHGRISEDSSQKNKGISKVAAFLEQEREKHPEENIFLNAGDLWQDTYESEASKGKCLIESMIQMDCEAMAIGNHEFDWGLEVIENNKKLGDEGNFNLLGANVYNFDKNINEATTHADNLCDEYKIVEVNDLKIGIIGIIGSEQITSITSSIWENLIFVDPLEIVKDLSDELKNEKDCDAVILLAHSNVSSLGNKFTGEITKVSNVSNKKYIDACFTGHSHTIENEIINDVPFVQSSWKGEYLSHIELKIDNEVSVIAHENLSVQTDKIDANVAQIADKYITPDFIEEKNRPVLNIEGLNSFSTVNSGRLQAYATYEKISKSHQIDIVLNNGGRDTISISKTHYLSNETLFNSAPFFNKTIVATLSGQQLSYLIKVKACKYYSTLESLDSETLYSAAIIDYVLLHKNSGRSYDYVNGYDGNMTYVENATPFEIIKEFAQNTTVVNKEFFDQPGFSCLK